METGTLSVVATPIGNLEDITLRALRVLKEADIILTEDTRVTKKLLAHYSITGTELTRCDAEKEAACAERTIDLLRDGKQVAYVTDAGTPGVSDPGGRLVAMVRDELPEARIEAIPGPSSVTAALSIAGLSGTEFTFRGYVPHKKGRETFFRELTAYEHPVVFFESTHRIMKTLGSLQEQLPVDRKLLVCRELTKLHEETVSGSAEEVLSYFVENSKHQKGEFVLIIDAP